MTPQLLSVALAAGMALPARLPGAPSLKGVPTAPVAGAPRIIFAVPLKEAAALQRAAGRDVTLAGTTYHLGLGLMDGGELPLVVAQGGTSAVWTWAQLEAGQASGFPGGRLTASLDGNWLRLSAGGADAQVWLPALMWQVYNAASRLQVPAVVYAVLVQGSPADPDAVGLLRRDQGGNYFIAYRTRAEMANIDWVVAVDGEMYGIRPERGLLVVYKEPVPQVPGAAGGKRRGEL